MSMNNIAVLCGTSNRAPSSHLALAFEVGEYLAQHNIKIINGGCKMGLMGKLCEGAASHQGWLEGVATQDLANGECLYELLNKVHVVPTFKERKRTLFALSTSVLVLPGGIGTMDEMVEALSENQQAISGVPSATYRPIALLSNDNYFHEFTRYLLRQSLNDYIPESHLQLFRSFDKIDDAFEYLTTNKIDSKTINWWD